jgi:hypothetical protein
LLVLLKITWAFENKNSMGECCCVIQNFFSPYPIQNNTLALKMRPVDMSSHMVIKPGLDWPFDTQVPNSKNMIPLLERNESLVTWLQPCKGEIKDQFPVIKMGSRFYTLSLRQMKVRQPPSLSDASHSLTASTGAMEAHTPEEEFCEPRNNPACGR